ncbi:hypothetical protein UM590_10550 [Staphylococcus aureus]|nr:hypothetical protein UM590_10550 [Staphylococcus aureus]
MVINLNDKQTKTSKEGLISVSHPLAAKIGKDVLDQGGNAMDAVIANSTGIECGRTICIRYWWWRVLAIL